MEYAELEYWYKVRAGPLAPSFFLGYCLDVQKPTWQKKFN